ncbi:MAG: hypothetical protein NTY11_02800, partial [Candidatus Parcubacteria bacterium]|nr:hypothetical protein [Candidatus Parcubacteria bacterium]
DKLNKAVLDGKITEAQKSAIMTKRSEIQGRIDGLNNLSLEERKAVMQGIRDDVDKWKQENGANLGKFLNFGHRGIGWGCHKAEE